MAYGFTCAVCILILWRYSCSSDAPRVAVRLGSTLNASSIKAGDDVYLECVIESNPSAGLVSWTHNVSGWL